MPTVNVTPTAVNPTHDFSLTDGSTTHGYLLQSGIDSWTEAPASMPSRIFNYEQKTWVSGRGRIHYHTDPMGFSDGSAWSMTDQRLHAPLRWRFARGLRSCDYFMPGTEGVTWQSLLTTQRYVYSVFTASATYTAANSYIWIRKIGTPGTLTVEWRLDSDDSVLKTVTKTAADVTDVLSILMQFSPSSTQSLTSGTAYRIAIYGAGTDSATNCWQIGVDSSTTNSKISANGSSWSAATFTMFYRITPADVARKLHFFRLEGALYCAGQNDDNSNATLYINGDRGTATSATSTTIVCSGKSWTADRWINAKVRIYDGKGDGQIRTITDNDGTSLTVAAWDNQPDNTSKFIIYNTEWWTEITGHGITTLRGAPCVAGKIAWFPQGESTASRYMQVNASSYTFGNGGTTNKFDIMCAVPTATGGTYLYGAKPSTASVYFSTVVTTAAAFAAQRTVGESDYRITSLTVWNGELLVGKEDGWYKYSNTRVEKMNGGMGDIPVSSNCAVSGVHMGALWFGWNYSTQMLAGGQVDREAYYQGYRDMPQARRGVPSAYIGSVGWVFKATDAGSSGTSTINAWNGFGWHEVFRSYGTGFRVRGCAWSAELNSRSRLWIDVAGDMVYLEFPMNGATPLDDTSCVYQHDGYIETGTIDGNQRDYYKYFRELNAIAENLTSNGNTIAIYYQTDNNVGTTTWTYADLLNTSPFDAASVTVGAVHQIRFRLVFWNTSATAPGVMHGFTIPGAMSDPLRYQWSTVITVGDEQETKLGIKDFDPDTLDTQLKTWEAAATKLTVRCIKATMDNKTVILAGPHTAKITSTDTGKWSGTIWLTLREA